MGTTVSRYRILERLGGGGIGMVFKAKDTTLDCPVTLRFLPLDLAQEAEARKGFVHEARAPSAFQHSHTSTIHHIGVATDDQHFIVTDCFDGEELNLQTDESSRSTPTMSRISDNK